MYRKEIRLSWDKGVKEVKIIDQISEIPNAYTYHTHCKSPIPLISERDFAEKRVEIVEDKHCVIFGFSLPDGLYDEVKKVIRCTNYFNIQEIEERNDYWLLTTYSQSDLKMPIPESFLSFTLPMKFNSWYEDYIKFFTKALKAQEKERKEQEKQAEKERKEAEKRAEKERKEAEKKNKK